MANEPIVRERVQELTWALLDEQITDDEMSLLDNLLLSDDAARKRYVECVQLHVGLISHYAKPTEKTGAVGARSPVLGFLNAGTPPLGFDLPSAEDLK